jgi:integrase
MAAKVTLTFAADEYVRFLKARKLAQRSIQGAEVTLKQLIAQAGDILLVNVTPIHIEKMFTAQEWKEATRNTKLSHLNGFLTWARGRKYIPADHSPTLGWRSMAVPQRDRVYIPVEDWPALMDSATCRIDRMVVALGLYSFMRGSEMRRVTLGDIDLDRCEMNIYRVKTKQSDILPIPTELDKELRSYLTWYTGMITGPLHPDYFLLPPKNTDMAKGADNKWIPGTSSFDPTRPLARMDYSAKRVLVAAGWWTDYEGAHTLRRSGARAYFNYLLEAGYDGALRRVQTMLGHSTTAMTERYLSIDLDRKKRNEDLRGKPMFSSPNGVADGKVVALRSGR